MKIINLKNANFFDVKLQLSSEIAKLIKENYKDQSAAAEALNTVQSKISLIANRKTKGFSLERLLLFLTRLDRKVQIVIK